MMENSKAPRTFPFVYGTQYYRAPTPEPEHWERDLAHMKQLGFNTVKYWVQWRWSERSPGEYYWEDLDRLMELAERNKLRVILNLICDVMPVWSERKYPDCRMVDRNGIPVRTEAVLCRQLGGYPGPCYRHPGMKQARQAFFRAALEHFEPFPALLAWDVWNEPEHHLNRRSEENDDHLLCYCPHCAEAFRLAMKERYGDIAALNRRWGRCYRSFAEVELPTDPLTIADFIDWREFQLDTLTEEAEWRLRMVRRYAPERFPHLHVVANTIECFNSTNCVDDFALAEQCEIFGSTMTNDPLLAATASSAAGGRPFYNAEWHLNFGSTAMHQRVIDRETFLREAIPQLAWDVRGILYWQFRPETLGFESPAWGLIRGDDSERPVTRHAREFIEKLTPFLPRLMRSRRAPATVALLRSRRNELFFHVFPHGSYGNRLCRSLRGWSNVLDECAASFRLLSTEQLEHDELEGIRLLILPDVYYMSQAEAAAVDGFLRKGGVVIAEGSVAGYCHDSGRHADVLPGCGLAERWSVREIESVSSFHLDCSDDVAGEPDASGDVAKALKSVGTRGGEIIPLKTVWGRGAGALTLSTLEAEDAVTLASFRGEPCVIEKSVGNGLLIYAGSCLGVAAQSGADGFLRELLTHAMARAEVKCYADEAGVHVMPLFPAAGSPAELPDFLVVKNPSEQPQPVEFPFSCADVFEGGDGCRFSLSARQVRLFARIPED